jgi:hypothetical protein
VFRGLPDVDARHSPRAVDVAAHPQLRGPSRSAPQ